MHTIQIDASPHQIRKLKKGHRVRVKKGTGFELLVHPSTYNIVSRSFNKGKGSEIQLSPEEIDMNQGISKAISPESHTRSLKPTGPTVSKPVDSSENKPINMNTMFGQGISSKIQLADHLNHRLGTNYGYLARAGIDNAINSNISAGMAKHGINSRYGLAPSVTNLGLLGPQSRMTGGQIEKATIGLKGGMMSSYTPPALVSQPFSANFQFQHFLPPQYQHFNTGGHADIMGNGLYV
jgi:hypothetical protein